MIYPAIGFVGLGNMGNGMAKKLLSNGFNVVGFDTDEAKLFAIKSLGFKPTSMPDISRNCELVILCLPNPDISRKVIFDQLLADANTVSMIIETSTLNPEVVTDFAEKLATIGKQFISAPMIGGKNHAADGKIEFLVEGTEQDCRSVQDIFEAMGASRFMGKIPTATLAKLSFNLSRYANLAVGVETHRLLEKYNANIPAIYEFMSEQSLENFGQVWKEDLKEMMAGGASFKPRQVPKKDLGLLAEMARHRGLDSKLIESIRETYLSMEQSDEPGHPQ